MELQKLLPCFLSDSSHYERNQDLSEADSPVGAAAHRCTEPQEEATLTIRGGVPLRGLRDGGVRG